MQKTENGGAGIPWRAIGWAAAAIILLLPWVTNAPWTMSDFIIMGVLLGGAGLVLELVARASRNLFYRAGAALAVAGVFLLTWVNGAVGFFGSEDNPVNIIFLAVAVVLILGSLLARFRPAGMAWTLFAAAAGQALIGAIGLALGLGSPGAAGVHEAVLGTSLFCGIWLASAICFRNAVRAQGSAAATP